MLTSRTREGRQQNRRVEVVFSDNGGQFNPPWSEDTEDRRSTTTVDRVVRAGAAGG